MRQSDEQRANAGVDRGAGTGWVRRATRSFVDLIERSIVGLRLRRENFAVKLDRLSHFQLDDIGLERSTRSAVLPLAGNGPPYEAPLKSTYAVSDVRNEMGRTTSHTIASRRRGFALDALDAHPSPARRVPRFEVVMEPTDLYTVFDNLTGCPAESGGISLTGMTAENAAESCRLLGECQASNDRATLGTQGLGLDRSDWGRSRLDGMKAHPRDYRRNRDE